MRTFPKFIAAILLLFASPAWAILPAADSPAEPVETVEQEINPAQSVQDDELIGDRLRGIFAELPDFAGVSVAVNEGVVTLNGTVSDAEAVERAGNIAGRVTGVVTVENSLERDLSVDGNLSIFGQISGLIEGFVEILPLLAVAVTVAILIGLLGYIIAGLGFIWDRIAPNAFLGELIRSAIRFFFVVGGIVIALDMLGAAALLGAVLGGAGVIGLALGFAMRDTVENYVASLMLSLRQPFRANDHVLIDDLEGHVIRLTSRATVLMTLEGNHLRVPNSQVFKAVIVNFTRNPQRRFQFELGVDADDDPRAAMQLGREVLGTLGFVLDQPEPSARIENVGDSNIVIAFLGWVDQRESDYPKSRSLAIAAVKEALEEAGFALPEPIYRLRFDGRTDPLPIGRSSKAARDKAQAPPKQPASTPQQVEEDVKPETEIRDLVDQERKSGDEQGNDLLDTSRPVE